MYNISQTSIKASSLTLKSICMSSFIFFSSLSNAEQWYQVELIVFEIVEPIGTEQSPIKFVPTGDFWPGTENEFMQPAENSTLLDSANKLKNSPLYHLHYHQSWQQPIKTKSHAKSINIESANEMVLGQISLHKATYLHVTLDIQLNSTYPQENASPNIEGVPKPYLAQTRRIRSNKLHFFDHPNMGVLLKLSPVGSPINDQESLIPPAQYSSMISRNISFTSLIPTFTIFSTSDIDIKLSDSPAARLTTKAQQA